MSSLSKQQVLHVADLAKLKLSSSQVDKFSGQLSKVLDLINELSEVNTDDIEPTSQTTGLTNVLRSDEIDVTSCLTQDEATSGTENVKNGFVVVPQILNKDA